MRNDWRAGKRTAKRIPAMSGSKSQAGGCLLALSALAGAAVGVAIGQPSAGVVIGTAIGILLALIIWIIDRRRG